MQILKVHLPVLRTEADDKSSIPLIIKIVCPNARTVPTEICVEMFFKLSTDTKFLFESQHTIKRAIRTK